MSIGELLKARTPTIVFVENYGGRKGRNHFVVYVGHTGDNIKIIDPLYKPLQKMPKEKFAKKWGNVAIVTQLSPFLNFRRKVSRAWTVAMCASLALLASTIGLVYFKPYIAVSLLI